MRPIQQGLACLAALTRRSGELVQLFIEWIIRRTVYASSLPLATSGRWECIVVQASRSICRTLFSKLPISSRSGNSCRLRRLRSSSSCWVVANNSGLPGTSGFRSLLSSCGLRVF